MRPLLLLFLLLLPTVGTLAQSRPPLAPAELPAQAQASAAPAAAFPASLPAASSPSAVALPAVDTAAALHRLFERRRHSGHVTLATGAGLLVVSYTTAAIANTGGSGALAPFLFGVLGTVISVPILARGIVLTLAHSKGREQRVLQAWQQHRLPARWARRALVPAYMQPPT